MKPGLTYEYDTAKVSHFSLKRADNICRENGNERNTLIGVFCKACEHYIGIRDGYVLCANKAYKFDDVGPNVSKLRSEIIGELRHRALTALDYM